MSDDYDDELKRARVAHSMPSGTFAGIRTERMETREQAYARGRADQKRRDADGAEVQEGDRMSETQEYKAERRRQVEAFAVRMVSLVQDLTAHDTARLLSKLADDALDEKEKAILLFDQIGDLYDRWDDDIEQAYARGWSDRGKQDAEIVLARLEFEKLGVTDAAVLGVIDMCKRSLQEFFATAIGNDGE